MSYEATVKAVIRKFSADELYGLVVDAEKRIGSHVAGGNVNDAYIKKQSDFIELIANELNGRECDEKAG